MSVAAPPRTPSVDSAAGAGGEPPPEVPTELRRPHVIRRAVLGCVIVLLASAGASAAFVSGEIGTLRKALSQNTSLSLAPGTLAKASYGAPETILLVGNDQRNHTTTTPVLPHSNEMLLVRFDPGKPYISMMSIPRELEVRINPPNGPPVTTRLNYAYTAGGIPLLVSTIKQVTGLSVNHVVVIDFNQFENAINEMGCVYSTVDRRYFHVNVPGGQQYFQINLQPGYQQMCGNAALQFVSYRHNDTSLVRDARDQSFLLDVKKEYGPTLVNNVHKFEQIFGASVQTDPDLHTTNGILDLLGTLISSSSLRVRQVQFQVNLLPDSATPCACDTASPGQISASVHSFLYGGTSSLPKQSTAAVANAVHTPKAAARLPLVQTPSSELAQAKPLGSQMPFPMEFPRVEDRGGSATAPDLRDYLIHAPGGVAYPVYVAVFSAGSLGQYYDVQGMQWTTAPLFDSPDQTINVAGRTYDLYYEGQHLQTIAWFEHGAVYWIHNSLLDSIGNGEMLAIAEQTYELTTPGAGTVHRLIKLKVATVPPRPAAKTRTSIRQLAGSVGGLVSLLLVPLLALLLLRRRRDLEAVRAHLTASLTEEARLVRRVATVQTGGWGTAIAAPAPALALAPEPRLVGPPTAAPSTAAPSTAAPSTAAPSTAARPSTVPAPATAFSSMSVYGGRRRGRTTAVLVVTSIAVLGAAAALGIALNVEGGRTVNEIVKRHDLRKTPARPAPVPIPAVSVLNAGTVNGAAGALALQLQAKGVKIENTGNLNSAPPPVMQIQYVAGDRAQAAVLARYLSARAPTIVPISPVTQEAAGSSARLVVVIP